MLKFNDFLAVPYYLFLSYKFVLSLPILWQLQIGHAGTTTLVISHNGWLFVSGTQSAGPGAGALISAATAGSR